MARVSAEEYCCGLPMLMVCQNRLCTLHPQPARDEHDEAMRMQARAIGLEAVGGGAAIKATSNEKAMAREAPTGIGSM